VGRGSAPKASGGHGATCRWWTLEVVPPLTNTYASLLPTMVSGLELPLDKVNLLEFMQYFCDYTVTCKV